MTSLIPKEPFRDIEEWFEEWPDWSDWGWPFFRKISPFHHHFPSLRTPKMNIYEEDNKIVAEVELPGINPKNIKVEVKDNSLRVEAKSEEKKEEKKKGYYRKEISSGFFKRVVPLPVEVESKKAEAEYEDGVLKVIIPKVPAKEKAEKTIKIKVKGAKKS